MQTLKLVAVLIPLCVASGDLSAGVRGFISWTEIDNGGISDGSGANLSGYRTFDLFYNSVNGDSINGFNLGTAANPGLDDHRIYTDGTVFNHVFGTDGPPNAALIGAFPALAFDTCFYIGDAPVSFVPGSADLSGDNGEIIGTWFTQPPQVVAAGGSIRFLRITLGSDTTYLGGPTSFIQVGFADNTLGDFAVNFLPTPGATSALLMGCAVMTRRRR